MTVYARRQTWSTRSPGECPGQACEIRVQGVPLTFIHRQYFGQGLLRRRETRILPRVVERSGERRALVDAGDSSRIATATNRGNRAQVAPMAAFLVAVFRRLVLVNGWEWCESAHTVVISIERRL